MPRQRDNEPSTQITQASDLPSCRYSTRTAAHGPSSCVSQSRAQSQARPLNIGHGQSNKQARRCCTRVPRKPTFALLTLALQQPPLSCTFVHCSLSQSRDRQTVINSGKSSLSILFGHWPVQDKRRVPWSLVSTELCGYYDQSRRRTIILRRHVQAVIQGAEAQRPVRGNTLLDIVATVVAAGRILRSVSSQVARDRGELSS